MKPATVTLATGLTLAAVLLSTSGCSSSSTSGGQGSGRDGGSSAAGTRVRRSWATLSASERKHVVDAFVALKKKTNLTWDYQSYCESPSYGPLPPYTKNAYDYFVELHIAAFTMLSSTGVAATNTNMPHKGPMFMPWHRQLLLRLEHELATASGDANFALPYFDWTSDPSVVFSTADIGDQGDCAAGTVSGYIVDQGFAANIFTDAARGNVTTTNSVVCGPKPLTRAAGCIRPPYNVLPTSSEVATALTIPTYDVSPYDTSVDQTMSFRDYTEGFTNAKPADPLCAIGGCDMHGRVHLWVGGSMSSGGCTPNDPIFFLHHTNVDRLWAMWQDKYGNTTYPSSYSGALYLFDNPDGSPVNASDMLDDRALGYVYDTQQ
jgi:tyrosinase